MKEKRAILAALVVVCFFFGFCLDAGAQLKKKPKKKKVAAPAEDLNASSEPDKLLYDRALEDLKHSRYTEGRLSLQTLINTYPDSEYLAKAKLAVADSYFKEGGVSNLTQSISEYKDFNTFFPFLDEAAYAQMQIGMAHFKMMEKADRDNAQAQMAEDELQTMLLKYPQSPLAPQAAQRLREVQEILADGQYKVARFYYAKGDTHAAGARLIELTDRYPLYSQSDEALWLLGDLYTKTKLATKDEDMRNVWGKQSVRVYSRIVAEYPLSKHVQEAKARLKGMGAPVPAIDPDALARMQKEQAFGKEHHSTFTSLTKSPMGMLRGAPDVSTAAHSGQPNLNPPTDAVSATEVLKVDSNKPGEVSGGQVSSNSGKTFGASGPTSQVDAQVSGPSGGNGTAGMQAGVQIITPLENGEAAPAAPAASTPAPADPTPAAASTLAPADTPRADGVLASPISPSAPATAQPSTPSSSPASESSSSQAAQGSSQGSTPAAGANPQPAAAAAASQKSSDSDDDKNESTSKKKKGLHKLIPW